MALTETVISNEALMRLGISRQITTVGAGTLAESTDTTIEHQVATFWYPRCRDRVLQDYPWTFARKFLLLTEIDDGDGEVWEDEWDLAYTYPTDCLKIRRFVSGVSAGHFQTNTTAGLFNRLDGVEFAFRYVVRQIEVATVPTKVILTDVENADARLEYTAQVTDAGLFTEQFGSMLAWLMATEMSMPLSVSGDQRQAALQGYFSELNAARASDSNEEHDHDEPSGPLVRSRGGV